MKNTFFLLMLLPFFLLSCGGPQKTTSSRTPAKKTGIQFTKSSKLVNVLDKAEGQGKLVFLDFYTSWCLPCKMMEKDVFPDKALGNYFNKNFISYKINAEKGNGVNLAYLYDVHVYPTLLFLDAKGNIIERKEGAAYHTELRDMAERALSTKNGIHSSR